MRMGPIGIYIWMLSFQLVELFMSPWVDLRFQKPKPVSFLSDLCLEIRIQFTNYISSVMPVYLFPMFPALMLMFLPSETLNPSMFALCYIAWNTMPYYGNRRKLIWDASLLPPLSCLLLLPSHIILMFPYSASTFISLCSIFSRLNTLFLHCPLINLTFTLWLI